MMDRDTGEKMEHMEKSDKVKKKYEKSGLNNKTSIVIKSAYICFFSLSFHGILHNCLRACKCENEIDWNQIKKVFFSLHGLLALSNEGKCENVIMFDFFFFTAWLIATIK